MAEPFSLMLQGGNRTSIGRSNAVVARVLDQPDTFPELIECLWSDDRLVRMRSADAIEKISAKRSDLLIPFKAELLGRAQETTEAELRWHFALMLPRLPLTPMERERAREILRSFLNDRSSIVKTFAIQALVDLAQGNASLQTEVIDLLERSCRTGTPAMKARSRKLLKKFNR